MKRPQYQKITDELLALIKQGELLPGERILSLRAIMRQHSVSQITALRVFKELLASGTVERREGLGYFVRKSQPLSLDNSSLFCVFRPPMQINPVENFGSRIFNGIVNAAASHRLGLTLSRHTLDLKFPGGSLSEASLQSISQELSALAPGTGILLDSRFSDEMISEYFLPHCDDKPLVLVGRRSALPVLSCSVPMTACAREMLSWSLRSEAQRYVLFPLQAVPDSQLWLQELESGFKKLGISKSQVQVVADALISASRDQDILRQLCNDVKQWPGQIMLLVSSDNLALNLQRDLRRFDIELGRDLTLISIGGYEGAMTAVPAISSIAINAERLGELAVQALLAKKYRSNDNYETDYKLLFNHTGSLNGLEEMEKISAAF
ncbi:MAG: substrate-binding domain-containing protein [Lentisphaeria bacterium]